jgi:hypothetical protein
MKLPSIRHLKEEALDTLARFPFALLSAIVATAATIIIIDYEYSSIFPYQSLYNICLIGFLGIPLFCSLQLVAERTRWKFSAAIIGKLVLLGILTGYYFSLPTNLFETSTIHLIRFMLFAIAAHLLVAAGPFTERGHINAFWEYNKILFLRFLTAVLYSGVLYTGLAIALVAVDQLFNVDIKHIRYFQLWWLLAGIFNTWFFLSGVPKKLKALDAEPHYPKGLKIFAQYVMIPLVAIYLLILYAYMGKIIVEWSWPKGWVGYLVICFSIVGIFSLLLIHPIKNQLKNKWIASIWHWFFYVLLPLVVLLLLAIWRRTSEYGITERRYFVIVLGLWLAAVALYFIFSRAKSIKIIPLSLCIIALVASFGPWGAFSISEWNQVNRLENVLTRNDILVNGKVRKAQKVVPFEDAKRISSIIRYLSEVHGFASIQPWFEEKLDTLMSYEHASRYYKQQENAGKIIQILGVRYVAEWESEEGIRGMSSYGFRVSSPFVLETQRCRYLISNVRMNAYTDSQQVYLSKQRWDIVFQPDSSVIMFVPARDTVSKFAVDLREFASRLHKQYGIQRYMENSVPQDSMVITALHKNTRVILLFDSFQIMIDSSGIRPVSAALNILMNP